MMRMALTLTGGTTTTTSCAAAATPSRTVGDHLANLDHRVINQSLDELRKLLERVEVARNLVLAKLFWLRLEQFLDAGELLKVMRQTFCWRVLQLNHLR
jgi:hypothetical protein